MQKVFQKSEDAKANAEMLGLMVNDLIFCGLLIRKGTAMKAFKRTVSFFLAAVVIFVTIPLTEVTATADELIPVTEFKDVTDPTSSIYTPIYWATENGIIIGCDDGTFRPNNICTRIQFCLMLWKLNGRPEPVTDITFSDTDYTPGSNKDKAIRWAVENGIVVGMGDGTFHPDHVLDRKSAAIMLWKMAGKPAVDSETYFEDVYELSPNVQRATTWGYEHGIMLGVDGDFLPNKPCLRSQAVRFIFRYAKTIMGRDMSIIEPEKYEGEPYVPVTDSMGILAQEQESNTDYLVMVDLTEHRVGLYEGEYGRWNEVFTDYCGDGAPGMETPTGEYVIYQKLYYFDSGNARCFYACRFWGAYLLHSTLFYQTPYPEYDLDPTLGIGVSHGCVRIRLENIKYIYDHCPYGTKVFIYYS